MADERSVEQLLDDADAAESSYSAGLAAITKSASADGVDVTVDLHGKLIGLRFARPALELTPAALSGVVRRLVAWASAAALADGLAVLGGLGEGLLPPAVPAPPSEEDETPTPAPWAVTVH
ncbi:hypothetical protein [Amycolatopsis sp. H20-H5]|uniref:hypothetical protein n=1 Tax=Amycolatopsis sp. H20-H5 TaxID=3046309 RepID=UPI002DBE7D97|nr:hypothetical protein [Amycolatopsis sp. H20-H5]MEC3976716.1 hypothetical protein [Amycolatopsis sp. H20-H5]